MKELVELHDILVVVFPDQTPRIRLSYSEGRWWCDWNFEDTAYYGSMEEAIKGVRDALSILLQRRADEIDSEREKISALMQHLK